MPFGSAGFHLRDFLAAPARGVFLSGTISSSKSLCPGTTEGERNRIHRQFIRKAIRPSSRVAFSIRIMPPWQSLSGKGCSPTTVFRSHWGIDVACAGDPRIKAAVGLWASYIDKYYILDTFSPRYKQLYGYLTGAKSEAELDRIVAGMAVEGREGNIKCPVLLTTGEYDARSPVELVYKFYDNIKGPKELWVYEDTYHWTNLFPGTNENADSHNMGRDWIREAARRQVQAGLHAQDVPAHRRRWTAWHPRSRPGRAALVGVNVAACESATGGGTCGHRFAARSGG
jgi:hypothetical protein